MIEGLAKTLVEPLATRWRNTALGSSAALWLVLILLYLVSHQDATACAKSGTPWCRLSEVEPVGPALLIVTAVGLVIATAFLAAGAASTLFALLTSDAWLRAWRPVTYVGRLLVQHQEARRDELAKRITASPAGASAGWRLDDRRNSAIFAYIRANYPAETDMLSPTACGNVLAAVAGRVDGQLGLNLTYVWQPLLAILSEEPLSRLSAQSSAVLVRCQQLIISSAALPLAALLPWSYAGIWLGSGLIAIWLSRAGMLSETRAFAEEVHATVVLNRCSLYKSLGMTPPPNPTQEANYGRTLTQLLQAFQEGDELSPLVSYKW